MLSFNDVDEVNFDAPLPGEREPWERASREYDASVRSCSRRSPRRSRSCRPIGRSNCSRPKRIPASISPGTARWKCWDFAGVRARARDNSKGSTSSRLRWPSGRRNSAIGCWTTSWPTRRRFTLPIVELKAGEIQSKIDALKKELPPISRAPAVMQAVESAADAHSRARRFSSARR